MTKKQWLQKRVLVDEWGRPPSLADVPMTIMTREQAIIKQGGSQKDINKMWKLKKESINGKKEK